MACAIAVIEDGQATVIGITHDTGRCLINGFYRTFVAEAGQRNLSSIVASANHTCTVISADRTSGIQNQILDLGRSGDGTKHTHTY